MTNVDQFSCRWCGQSFAPRLNGGTEKLHCRVQCRHEHREGRVAIAEALEQSGKISIKDEHVALSEKRERQARHSKHANRAG